jgi:hypothetical protein
MTEPSAIAVPSDAVAVFLGSLPPTRITNWPAQGTYLSIAKMSSLATVIEGIHTITFVKNKSKIYNVGLTVTQHHPDDLFLSAAIIAQMETELLQALSISYKGRTYNSSKAYILEEPTRELANDGSPHVTYNIAALFSQVIVGAFQQPPTLTTAQINSFQGQ